MKFIQLIKLNREIKKEQKAFDTMNQWYKENRESLTENQAKKLTDTLLYLALETDKDMWKRYYLKHNIKIAD